MKTESKQAISDLISKVSEAGAKAVLTFPDDECSNGISGEFILNAANENFSRVRKVVISSNFSTLGGNKKQREARKASNELVLILG